MPFFFHKVEHTHTHTHTHTEREREREIETATNWRDSTFSGFDLILAESYRFRLNRLLQKEVGVWEVRLVKQRQTRRKLDRNDKKRERDGHRDDAINGAWERPPGTRLFTSPFFFPYLLLCFFLCDVAKASRRRNNHNNFSFFFKRNSTRKKRCRMTVKNAMVFCFFFCLFFFFNEICKKALRPETVRPVQSTAGLQRDGDARPRRGLPPVLLHLRRLQSGEACHARRSIFHPRVAS